ncbi:hypothetical protein ABZ802_35790 [Streptomyces sp. NPDC047737]|uniref:hypothetical protein n=1 Tax=Streptomyces sp. NPDC047737 TaxID=3155740 RepID=UPI0033F27E6E
MSKRTAVELLFWLAIALLALEAIAQFLLHRQDLVNIVFVIALVVVAIRELLLRSADADDDRAAAGGGEQ